MTIKKKIAAVAAAAMMAMSITAISASAEYDVVKGTVNGGEAIGIVSADETYVEDIPMFYKYCAGTFYSGKGEIYVSLDIDNYLTGELEWRDDRSMIENIEGTNLYGTETGTNIDFGHRVTLFSAHEVYPTGGGEAWGRYMGLAGV